MLNLNFLRALCVLFLFGLLTACGGGGGGGNSASAPTPNPAPTMTMTMPPPNPTPMEPVMLGFDSPEIGVLDYTRGNGTQWFIVLSVAAGGENRTVFGHEFAFERLSVTRRNESGSGINLPDIHQASLHMHGDIVPIVNGGVTSRLGDARVSAAFQTRPGITTGVQLCPISWLRDAILAVFGRGCPTNSGMSYSPDMRRVVYAAMADSFHRGFAIGESNFAFSGRYDDDNRAAGFAYDFGNFAMRTDYVRLPSKQDSEVWLNTYRLGVVRPINDEATFFAGVDSYDNAIMAIDINTAGELWHRLGAAIGDGYAVQYELRLNL